MAAEVLISAVSEHRFPVNTAKPPLGEIWSSSERMISEEAVGNSPISSIG